jgi:hypothetical protein
VLLPIAAHAADGPDFGPLDTVSASAPTDVAVTVYRNPYGAAASLDLDGLGGFALVTETRTVALPAGETRLRFEGVADGIQSQSAIITGLPSGVLEKNHDAKVLSPAALVAATVGRDVWLVRTDPKTGKSAATHGTLLADTQGVVFQGSAGIEALRCSGLPETLHFERDLGANATPTLSAVVRSPAPVTAQVKLSYLAQGFDWMANYSAVVSPDGKSFDLGAWVTLANSNAVSFPDAHAAVVAGRLNRESGEVEPIDAGAEILAECWPRGSTSDTPEEPNIERAMPYGVWSLLARGGMRAAIAPAAMMESIATTAMQVQQEQLGDLKLYRVPERTSVSSRQIKQVRLMDRHGVLGELIYKADVSPARGAAEPVAFHRILRTRNDEAHRLGLPLPSGQVAAFYEHDGVPLLVNEARLRDVAVHEELEIELGEAPDVRLTVTGARIDVSNARKVPVLAEIGLDLPGGVELVRADHNTTTRNGRPTFRVTVPAQDGLTIRFQLTGTGARAVLE